MAPAGPGLEEIWLEMPWPVLYRTDAGKGMLATAV